ncbi:sulfotransferase domain-containing protein [Citreimonas salinaria]|uniref:Sulfotransferase domain-containing protein n=1 Tax=Citreimonas salinaria TaxID=321339 RepID=A0A1H3EZY5_9RHOB|nr:sulfotransferase domain-containing protein [Citreimonas salinaria]SDX84127.1 Sulfotransferase domain-containing protein [Citreimonas salinaria]
MTDSASRLSRLVTSMDNGLPRQLTVRRQQSIYWPSVWMHAAQFDARGSFFVNGFPSSGTNWLCHLASRYFDLPIFEPWTRLTPTLRPHVFHLHRFVDTRAARARTLYITRDGRDAIVSRYFKLVNPNDSRPLKAFEAASGVVFNKTKAREQLPAFIEWYFTEKRFSAMNWADHVRRAEAMDLPRLLFEDLKQTPFETLAPLFERVSGQTVDRARLEMIIDELDFSRVKNTENAYHLRKSQVGEWRPLYSQAAREAFARHAQDGLELMGFETDRSWIRETEDAGTA